MLIQQCCISDLYTFLPIMLMLFICFINLMFLCIYFLFMYFFILYCFCWSFFWTHAILTQDTNIVIIAQSYKTDHVL